MKMALLGTIAVLATAGAAHAAEPSRYLLEPAAVWSAGDLAPHAGWVVAVEGDRIVGVGPKGSVKAGAGALVIALPGETLIPGLIELHSHLLLHAYNEVAWDDQVLKEPPTYRVLRAGRDATRTLMSGFTTERDLGTEGAADADVQLKRAIDEGIVAGPRLFVATRAIVATGSYGPKKGFRADLELPQGAQEVSGEAEMVRAVREQAASGPTGSSSTPTTAPAPTARPGRRSPRRRWPRRWRWPTPRAGRWPCTPPATRASRTPSRQASTPSSTATGRARRPSG